MQKYKISTPDEFMKAIAIVAEMPPSLPDDPALRDDLSKLQPHIESYRGWKKRKLK